MIKEGQIYKFSEDCATLNYKIIITMIYDEWVCFVSNSGYANERDIKSFEKDVEKKYLILSAEYPTWQEAVNSKEFKE